MITRSNLAEQLREYQIRSKYDWASVSFFSATSNVSSRTAYKLQTPDPTQAGDLWVGLTMMTYHWGSKVDVMYVMWELLMFAFLVFSAVSLYFAYMKVAFLLICLTTICLVCMKITKQVRQNRKSKRRMLLPLSM